MNKVVELLAQMGSSTSFESLSSYIEMLSEEQKLAIEAKDLDTLIETMPNLPDIKCVPILPADDEDEEKEEDKDDDENNENRAINYVING